MTTALKCPSCSAQMELTFIAPGDKAARCPYCGTLVDLPDGPRGGGPASGARRHAPAGAESSPGNVKERTTEVEEEKVGDGIRVRRSVRVSERVSSSVHEQTDTDDLFEEARRLLDQAGAHTQGESRSWTSSKVMREEAMFESGLEGLDEDTSAMLDEVQAMLRDMAGSGSTPDPTPSTKERTAAEPPHRERPSSAQAAERPGASRPLPWWKRLFRRG